jgi:hypothetical protein
MPTCGELIWPDFLKRRFGLSAFAIGNSCCSHQLSRVLLVTPQPAILEGLREFERFAEVLRGALLLY